MRDNPENPTRIGDTSPAVREQMERLSRMIERESRRYPPNFEKRGER